MRRIALGFCAALAALFAAVCIAAAQGLAQESAAPAPAAAGGGEVKGVQAGFLTCNVSSGWGFILGSSRDLKCVWEPQKGVEYHYTGTVGQFGAEIGYHHSSVIIWAVATATNDFGAGGLVGTYTGVTAQAAAGAGGGVSVLVGGFNHSVTLQPISISGEIGLNAAAGIQAVTLRASPSPVQPQPTPTPPIPTPQATPRAPAPTPTSIPEAHVAHPYVVVPVFYATDRERTGSRQPNVFYGPGRNKANESKLQFGVAKVSIPTDAHLLGRLESPHIWKLEFHPNPVKHVVLLSIDEEPKAAFYSKLSSAVGTSSGNQVLVFVHGFNVTFEDTARRTAQIGYDLGFDGPKVLYSWPSQGKLTPIGYTTDETNVEWTAPHLESFLTEIAAQSGAKTIHVIAHSMGNRALATALSANADPVFAPAGVIRGRRVRYPQGSWHGCCSSARAIPLLPSAAHLVAVG